MFANVAAAILAAGESSFQLRWTRFSPLMISATGRSWVQ
jgi:hypothetical protein